MAVSITSNHSRNIGDRQTGNLAHNRREFTPRNVDPALTGNNIVFKSVTLGEVYEDAFGDAIDDNNRKQKRKGRIKYDRKSYFKHLFHVEPESESAKVILTSNARGKYESKSFNEELFQVGDCKMFGHFKRDKQGNFIDKNGNPVKWNKKKKKYYDINGNVVTDSSNLMLNPNAEIAKKILYDFFMGGRFKVVKDQNGVPSLKRLDDNDAEEPDFTLPSFEERNPNFRIICAVLHNDEWHGTPHIHIDYVAMGEGYVKGPEKQLGFERALKNMGFEDKNTAYKEWREKERIILKQICNYYGLETKSKEEETSRGETYAPDIYAKTVRDGCADAQAQAEKIRKKAEQDAKSIIDEAVKAAEVIRMRAELDAKAMREQADEYAKNVKDKALAEANNITNEAEQKAEELRAENKRLSDENEKIKCDTEQERKQLKNALNLAAKFPTKKIFSRNMFTIDKEKYDALTDALEYHISLVNNTLTSDEDRQAAADERKRQEQITANMEQEVQQRANQMILARKKALDDEYNLKIREFKKKYSKSYNSMVDYINDTTGRTVKAVLAEYFMAKRQDKLSWAVQNINAPQREKSRLGDEYLI